MEPILVRQKPIFVETPTKSEKPNAFVEILNAFLPVFGALAAVLAVRLFLLFAIVGAFILAQTALEAESYYRVWVLVSYCSFTVIPLVWLEVYGKK